MKKKTTLYQERNEEKRAEFKKQLDLIDPETLYMLTKKALIIGFLGNMEERLKAKKSWLISQEEKERGTS